VASRKRHGNGRVVSFPLRPFMQTMPPTLFKRYEADPYGTDAEVREQCQVPDNRYYTVSTWPPERAGMLEVDRTRVRVPTVKKVSKSDQ